MASEKGDSEKSFKILGIADVFKIPCARESFLYGSLGGVAVGLVHFLATSRVLRSYYVAVGGYALSTTVFWFCCRYDRAKKRFEQRMIQEGIKNMILYEGTQYDRTKEATTTEERRL
ncbi:cytochrome c oxidase assembly protein COX20, mitochondrial [Pogona vitticeps]|nr:cytochrome c oxidase protein 20 homolog [Pogona vitticeps]